jgi:hypothetical protein
MSEWTVKVGWGWRDRLVPELHAVLTVHDHGDRPAVLVRQSNTAVAPTSGEGPSSDLSFWPQLPSLEGAYLVFAALRRFLDDLENPEIDVASLIFFNFEPRKFSLEPRPEGDIKIAPTLAEGLRLFSSAVERSIRPERSMWSSCEWAMLSCSRQA